MDCSGLIRYYLYVDKYGDDPRYNSAIDTCVNVNRTAVKEKGSMSTTPELPGVLVRMEGHVGVYIGNGEVIESQGTAYGVRKTKLDSRGWTQWFKLPEITYTSVSSDITLDTKSYVFNQIVQLYTFLAKCDQKPTVSSSNPSAISVTYRGSDIRGYLYDIKPLTEGLSYISATLNGKIVGFKASLGCKIDTSFYNLYYNRTKVYLPGPYSAGTRHYA